MECRLEALRAYRGPNRFAPQPQVVAWVRAPDVSVAEWRRAITDTAHAVGLVVGGVAIDVGPEQTLVRFSAGDVVIGAAVCDLAAQLFRDEVGLDDSAITEAVWRIGRERRARLPPIAVLQVRAEAQRRGVLVQPHRAGGLLLGTGRRGWWLPPEALTMATFDVARDIPWQHLANVPLLAVISDTRGVALAEALARRVGAHGTTAAALHVATFDDFSQLMSDTTAEVLVCALDAAALAAHGVPFERCAGAVLLDIAAPHRHDAGVVALLAESRGMLILDAALRDDDALDRRVTARNVTVVASDDATARDAALARMAAHVCRMA
jgi:hypothetical protein